MGAPVIHVCGSGVSGKMNASASAVDSRVARPPPLGPSVRGGGCARVKGAPASTPGLSALIVAIAERHDRDAFAALFTHFAPRVKSYMLSLGATPQMAEELAQETMLIVWRRAGAFDASRAGASTWIFTIARNLRIDASRRDRRQTIGDDPSFEATAPPLQDAAMVVAHDELRIAAALETLSADQAQVVREA